VVVGAGGAARAVVWALLDAGAGPVHVANRTAERARALAADLSGFGEVSAGAADGSDLPERLAAAAIAVNATTQGMTTDTVAFDVTPLDPRCLVFDLVYVPPETPLLQAALERGLAVSNGLEMLVRQGEIAFERWTGVAGTADVMRQALRAWLADPVEGGS
jgi:shikimate dehydrogenase